MSGIPHDHYEPKTGIEKWIHARLPIVGLLYDTLRIPTPKNSVPTLTNRSRMSVGADQLSR